MNIRNSLPRSPCSTDSWSTPGPRHATSEAAAARYSSVPAGPKGLSRRAGPPCRLLAQLPEVPASVQLCGLHIWDMSLVQAGIDPSRVFNRPGLRENVLLGTALPRPARRFLHLLPSLLQPHSLLLRLRCDFGSWHLATPIMALVGLLKDFRKESEAGLACFDCPCNAPILRSHMHSPDEAKKPLRPYTGPETPARSKSQVKSEAR